MFPRRENVSYGTAILLREFRGTITKREKPRNNGKKSGRQKFRGLVGSAEKVTSASSRPAGEADESIYILK